ncbi:hypothetical protein DYL59_07440 [Pseudomonas kairouanensis]|uniref:Uncharacterized protein n=1 Tax=Pseudomonas kairouanensis TaxID=2293832 RepID=A0A4Z0AWU1_9PSED|nr:hypothetical protein DYL59_07440 [Pseudomonas kairouanensis]
MHPTAVEICLGQYMPDGVKLKVLQWRHDTPPMMLNGGDLYDLDQLNWQVWSVFPVSVFKALEIQCGRGLAPDGSVSVS